MKKTFNYIAIVAIYFALAKLGLALASMHSNVSPVWPASGFAIGVLLLKGFPYWSAISCGAFLANITTDISFVSCIGISIGNTLEAVIASLIISNVNKKQISTQQFELAIRIVLGSAFAAIVGSVIGTSTLVFYQSSVAASFEDIWKTWFVGDLLGALVIVPIFTHFITSQSEQNKASIDLKLAINFLICILCICFIFLTPIGKEVPFLVLPLLLVSRMMSGVCGMYLSVLIISASSIYATSLGFGPFAYSSQNSNLTLLQLFMFGTCVSAIGIGSIPRFNSLRLASLVLVCGWILSCGVYYIFRSQAERLDSEHFFNLIKDVEGKLENRMRIYSEALMSGASLYSASEVVDMQEWKTFVSSLNLAKRYPGIHGMGVILPVKKTAVTDYLNWAKTEVSQDFEIKTLDNVAEFSTEDRFVITFIEPLMPNLQARGLDVGAEPKRRIAAERARLKAEPAMTERISLIQDKQKGSGFLLFVPVYKKNLPHDSPQERIENLELWIYAPFISRDFFKYLNTTLGNEILLKVFDGKDSLDIEPIYSSADWQDRMVEVLTTINLAGHDLKLAWAKGPNFKFVSHSVAVWLGISAALCSLFFSGIIASLSLLQRRADELVCLRTAELERSQKRAVELAQEACLATASKSTFLATMSHEIRTPLNGIAGMTELVLGTALTDEQKDYLNSVKSCTESLLTIINDILDFSKIEAGKLLLSREQICLRHLVRGIVNLLSVKVAEKKLNISIHFAEDIAEYVWGDKTRIGQILINLIGNAIKFTPESGQILISAKPVMGLDSGTTLEFSVSDNGIGIPADKLESIFEPFSQADISTTRKFGGTGLGLSISRQLVELMHGKLWVESVRGEGSKFYFTIPIENVDPSDIALQKEIAVDSIIEEPSCHSLNILLAEDNSINQKLIVKIFEKRGHKVTIAQNGQEAVDLIKKNSDFYFDIVLMDCQMPVLNGYEATKLLRQHQSASSKRIPIIALTANAQEEDREYCINSGMDDYISKPFKINEILTIVYRWGQAWKE